jgi:hypothetical protein
MQAYNIAGGLLSANWTAMLQSDFQRIATRIDILQGGVPVATSVAPRMEPGSSVTVDKAQASRRTCAISFTDPTGTLTPAVASDVFHPMSGYEFRLSRGFTYSDGSTELVSLGIFAPSSVTVDDTPNDLVINVTGFDRARAVGRRKLGDVYSIPRGLNAATAIQALINSQYPGLTYLFMLTSLTTALMALKPGADPWSEAITLATSLGAQLFFDVSGRCVLIPEPDPTQTPVAWTYSEGAQAMLTHTVRTLTNEAVPSHVIRDGQGSSTVAPVRGEAKDLNPASPTFIGGPYGDVLDYSSNSLYTTSAQCQVAAQAALNRRLGIADGLSISHIVNPAHDVDDVVVVNRSRSKLANLYVIDSMTVPLGPDGVLQTVCRRVS